MTQPSLLLDISPQGVATLTLNRPEIHNAFDEVLIQNLTTQLLQLAADPQVRVVLLAANGKSFSAGADMHWMRRTAQYTQAENLRDAVALARLMNTLYRLAKPTIALVQGPAYGGGVGLAACCDMVIATTAASFCLSEVKVGLIPAAIGPYVIAAIGERAARRYFLTAERFDVQEAYRLGLVQQIVDESALMSAGLTLATTLLNNSPQAVTRAKEFIAAVVTRPIDEASLTFSAETIAELRATAEAQEGLTAFLEKRKPAWIKKS